MESQQQLIEAIAAVPGCKTAEEVLKLADQVDQGWTPVEVNFPAEILMYLGMQDMTKTSDKQQAERIKKSAEEALLQLLFLNNGPNPPCSFIMVCYNNGWRAGSGNNLVQLPQSPEGSHA